MKELKEKFHSQRGASILLALLFLLVCMMVAASVLMAAVSNAGKIRSNYEEQQRYLALSSALRLVAGEIGEARYYGQYTVNEWTEVLTVTETDENGNVISTPVAEYPYYNVDQNPGRFICGRLAALNPDGTQAAGSVLSFRKELDGAFAGEFGGAGYHPLTEGADIAPLPTNPPGSAIGDSSRTTRTLTVEVQGGGMEELFHPVTVEIDMSQSRRIHLKATLPAKVTGGVPDKSGGLYVMEAELAAGLMRENPASGTAEAAGSGLPVIDYSPGNRMPKDKKPEGPVQTESGTLSVLEGSEKSEPCMTRLFVTWKLDWITREVKEADG